VFQRVLQKKPYFVSLDGTPLAEACSWHEFIEWLKIVEVGEKKTPEEKSARKAVEHGTAEKSEEEEEVILAAERDLLRVSAERYVDNTAIKEKPTHQQSLSGSSWDRKPLRTQPSWSNVDDHAIVEDNDEDEENYEPPAVCYSSHCCNVTADSF
jgi:hypothetical protein